MINIIHTESGSTHMECIVLRLVPVALNDLTASSVPCQVSMKNGALDTYGLRRTEYRIQNTEYSTTYG